MEKIYRKVKGRELVYAGYKGIICGYSSSKFIIATTDKTDVAFRRFDKKEEPFIEEEYKDPKFRYCWCDERDFIKQFPRLKWI